MTFARLMELYRQLRQEVVRHAGDSAFSAIEGLSLPTGENDELSFLRLVIWSYALLQENGRVPLRFLRELGSIPKEPVSDLVMALRAWSTHNLSLGSESDRRRLDVARVWIRASCGRHLRLDAAHWQQCFGALCSALSEMLDRAIESCSVLDDVVDGPHNVAELQQRVRKNWEAYHFDQFVREAAGRLGLEDIDIVTFRGKHLSQWRKVVEVSSDGSCRRLLTQRIEADLLTWFGDSLPVTAAEVLQHVPLSSLELSTLLLAVRAHRPGSRTELEAALEDLAGRMLPRIATDQEEKGSSTEE